MVGGEETVRVGGERDIEVADVTRGSEGGVEGVAAVEEELGEGDLEPGGAEGGSRERS